MMLNGTSNIVINFAGWWKYLDRYVFFVISASNVQITIFQSCFSHYITHTYTYYVQIVTIKCIYLKSAYYKTIIKLKHNKSIKDPQHNLQSLYLYHKLRRNWVETGTVCLLTQIISKKSENFNKKKGEIKIRQIFEVIRNGIKKLTNF